MAFLPIIPGIGFKAVFAALLLNSILCSFRAKFFVKQPSNLGVEKPLRRQLLQVG